MKKTARMMMLAGRPRTRRVGVEYEDTAYNRVDPYYMPESRFRDRTGREHYNDGRYAPQSRMDQDYSEDRQRDSRGRYMRMDDSPRDYYDPYIHGNERRMNPIGFRMSERDHAYIGDDPRGHEEHERGHAAGYGGHPYGQMDKRTAEAWTREMRNADGTHGAHWTMDKTTEEMRKRGIECDPVEFWAAMNMLYSDYCKVFERNNVANMALYCDLAKAFLDDEDAVKGKLMAYYECVVAK